MTPLRSEPSCHSDSASFCIAGIALEFIIKFDELIYDAGEVHSDRGSAHYMKSVCGCAYPWNPAGIAPLHPNLDPLASHILYSVPTPHCSQINHSHNVSVAPHSIKKLVRFANELKLPEHVRHVGGGLNPLSALTLTFVIVTTVIFKYTFLDHGIDVMVKARDVLCSGDTQFVYTNDGAGVLVWGYPQRVQDSPEFAHFYFSRNFPDGSPPSKSRTIQNPITMSYGYSVIDLLLRQQGRESVAPCPLEECFDTLNRQAPLPDRPDCCLAKKLRVPNIDVGVFSLARRAGQGTEVGADLWNSNCYDWLDAPFEGGIMDILENTMVDASRALYQYQSQSLSCTPPPAGNFSGCPNLQPFCLNGECVKPKCKNFEKHCTENSYLGVQVRQLCPVTCGCSHPRSPLTLFMPESGCPSSCLRSGHYLAKRRALPCEDLPKTDPTFVALVDDLDRTRQNWPADLQGSAQWDVQMLRSYGCAYFGNETYAGEGPPPNRFHRNICTEYTSTYPHKPFSYFCPVACRCRKGQKHCPDSCPSPSASEPACSTFQQTLYADPFTTRSPGECPMLAIRDEFTFDDVQP